MLDGFPRSVDQAVEARKLADQADAGPDAVVYLDAPREELVRRILARAKVEGRADDNEETVQNRLRVFDEATRPLVDYYRERGLLHVIDAAQDADARHRGDPRCAGLIEPSAACLLAEVRIDDVGAGVDLELAFDARFGPGARVTLVLLDDLVDRAVLAQLAGVEVEPALAEPLELCLGVRDEEQRLAVGQQRLDPLVGT